MRMSPEQTRWMLIVISIIFAVFALTTSVGEDGTPGIGIAMAGALTLLAIIAARSGPPTRERDAAPTEQNAERVACSEGGAPTR